MKIVPANSSRRPAGASGGEDGSSGSAWLTRLELALDSLDTNSFQWIWQTTAVGRVVEVVRFMPVDDVHPSASFPKPHAYLPKLPSRQLSRACFSPPTPTRRAARPLDSRRAVLCVY